MTTIKHRNTPERKVTVGDIPYGQFFYGRWYSSTAVRELYVKVETLERRWSVRPAGTFHAWGSGCSGSDTALIYDYEPVDVTISVD